MRRELSHVTSHKLCLFFRKKSLYVSIQVLMHALKDRKNLEEEHHIEERHPWIRSALSVVHVSVIRGLVTA